MSNDRITEAVARAVAADSPFAHRYQAAGRLLGRGHTRTPRGFTFADGATSNGRACDCQEGGHIECLHKIAARLLDEAEADRPLRLRVRKVPPSEAARWI